MSTLMAPIVGAFSSVVSAEIRRDPFQRDPAFVAEIFPLLKALNRYFGTEFRGWEHVPKNGPFLIVGNHSGGAESNDFWFLLYKWTAERGSTSPLYSLAYNVLFSYPLVGPAIRRLGALPANHANGRKALARRAAVVVFPGGDYEVFRPWSERNRIDFAGHLGFVRLALSTGVPVVPMTIHGAHQSTLVLTRGRGLAHVAGIDRLHINVFPFIWNIPFGPTPAFVPSLQLPSKVTVHFDRPLDWSHYGARRARDPEVVRRCYDEITAAMQKTLDRLEREHPYPVLARLRELGLGAAPDRPAELLAHRPPARRQRRPLRRLHTRSARRAAAR